jgi:hypothetical protein
MLLLRSLELHLECLRTLAYSYSIIVLFCCFHLKIKAHRNYDNTLESLCTISEESTAYHLHGVTLPEGASVRNADVTCSQASVSFQSRETKKLPTNSMHVICVDTHQPITRSL